MSEQQVENVENQVLNKPPVEAATEQKVQDETQPEVSQLQFENFDKTEHQGEGAKKIDLLMDLMLSVSIELGRTKMFIKDILELERGSIIELEKMAGEPVDLFINNKKMAEGEVVVVDKHFGIRITNLIDPKDRIKNLGKDI